MVSEQTIASNETDKVMICVMLSVAPSRPNVHGDTLVESLQRSPFLLPGEVLNG